MTGNNPKVHAFQRRARDAVCDFRIAIKRLSGDATYEELRTHWSLALSEFRKFLKFAETAARERERNGWADNLIKERKDNPILNYAFHARNAEEHGHASSAKPEPAALRIGGMFSFAGNVSNVTISNCREITTLQDGRTIERRVDGQFSTTDGKISSGWLNSQVPVNSQTPYIQLLPAMDRGQSYQPPMLKDVRREDLADVFAQKICHWMEKKLKELEGF
ncbi:MULTISPECIES: hypothetical protein [Thioclava]|nr:MULTISPECIES: hypothetical protein [Thioclava]